MGACSSTPGRRDINTWATDAPDDHPPDVTHHLDAIYSQPNIPASCVIHTTDNFCASSWDDGSIKVIDWKAKQVVHTWTTHSRSVNKLLYAQQTKSLFSCSRDTTIARHALASPLKDDATSTTQTYSGHTLTVSSLAIDHDEKRLASGSRDTSVALWDVETAARIQQTIVSQNIVTCMAWVPTEAQLVAQGGEDLRLRIWDCRAWKSPAQTIEGYVYFPLALDISEDGVYLFTTSKGFNAVGCEGRVWDRRTGKQVVELTGHSQDTTACAYIPHHNDEGVTASKDSTIRVWNMETGEQLSSSHDASSGMFTSLSCVRDGAADTTPSSSPSSVVQVLTSSFSGRIDLYRWDRANSSLERLQ
ncbi:hypothetical protein LEN26_016204 [Aphanomyces euteiches]|nr:hypothetical protein LEN26_016204 [Aphanomyces euteiches]KAH9106357.1 hypothetical protein AeMF1_018019 [Aphanomyces euteiches]